MNTPDKTPSLGRQNAQRIPLSNVVTLAGAVETLLDPLVIVAGLLVSSFAVDATLSPGYEVLALIAFSLSFPGNARLKDSALTIFGKALSNTLLLAGFLLLFGYASGYLEYFPEELVLAWFVSMPFALFGCHMLARWMIPGVLKLCGAESTAVICGVNDIGDHLAKLFIKDRHLGIRFLGYFDDRKRERLIQLGNNPLLGTITNMAEYVKNRNIDRIYLALPMATQPRILALLDGLKDTTASVYFVPDIFVTDMIQGRSESVGGIPVVAVCDTPFAGFSGIVKRAEDIVISALILALISPILLAVALGVKLSSPGPVIFRQRRYGLDGKEILVYKFRSMTVTEDGTKVTQATRDDKRITPFGAFIRRTSLDELPQFINVIQGRMSIVGPRPHAVAHNELYRSLIKGYMVRHKVRPGITGWAQVNGYRGETDTVEKMEMRINYDLEYLRNWSLLMDLKIIARTVLVFVNDKAAY
ncbi:undecaprenyl-phosphate glucose phosphotransferase [Niveibacterium terrae]|uniref:undecaprenyl-phosphate glucose phosphotransferase n=1 Tax=Niveibacterium terrae TaxID=3373598 RepID=UPI003A926F99